jgi:hypothetical protein
MLRSLQSDLAVIAARQAFQEAVIERAAHQMRC